MDDAAVGEAAEYLGSAEVDACAEKENTATSRLLANVEGSPQTTFQNQTVQRLHGSHDDDGRDRSELEPDERGLQHRDEEYADRQPAGHLPRVRRGQAEAREGKEQG